MATTHPFQPRTCSPYPHHRKGRPEVEETTPKIDKVKKSKKVTKNINHIEFEGTR